MKNPAKPSDFGTNGTRGVVGSGMRLMPRFLAFCAIFGAVYLWHVFAGPYLANAKSPDAMNDLSLQISTQSFLQSGSWQ